MEKTTLQLWNEANEQLKAVKAKEAELRKQVVSEYFNFSEDELREGTENKDIGNGYKLKAVFKTNRRLNNADDAVEKALIKIEKIGSEGQFLADRLVNWKPELSVSEYKKLPEKAKKIIDEVITSSPATPSIEIVAPKAK